MSDILHILKGDKVTEKFRKYTQRRFTLPSGNLKFFG
jgi:hypothetical protein